MSFASLETSVDSGRPLQLLLISYSQQSWYYTTSEVPVVHNLQTYLPSPMSTGNIQPTGDASKASLKVRVPYDAPVGDLFRVRPPSEIVTVTLFERHFLDNDFQVAWKGRITGVEWVLPWLELIVENVFASLRRPGLRRRFGIPCPHTLYEGGCNVDRELHKVSGTVGSISGSTVNIAAINSAAAGYYSGGYAEWVSSVTGAIDRQMIMASGPGSIFITSSPIGLSAGSTIDVYPGCDHLLTTCDLKFGNTLNYGGMPFTPQKNPFNGSTIY